MRDHLRATHGLRDEQISNGVHIDLLAADKLDPLRQEARARLGVGDRVLFLASAFNMHLKGVDVAIKALKYYMLIRVYFHDFPAATSVSRAIRNILSRRHQFSWRLM